MAPVHVVAIVGSLRDGSHSRVATQHALAATEQAGASTDLLDLRAFDLPLFDADDPDAGDAPELRERVRAADSILLATPMYHGSYSSVIKTALDYCGFDEFADKTVGLLCVAGGAFPVSSLEHLRSVCRAMNSWVLPSQAAVPRSSEHIAGGEITDQEIADRVATLGKRLVEYANIEPEPPSFESRENVGG